MILIASAMVAHRRGAIMSPHAIRRLPISRQIIDKVCYVDPREVLAAVDAKFRAAPVVAHGRKRA